MEHQKIVATKSMTKILKYLPTATSSVSFQSPSLYSPVKDKKPSEKPHKSNLGIGFSGPILSTLPSDTHRKINNDSKLTLLHEPTSPRVSCVGTVKCKRYRKLTNKPTNKFSRTTSYTPVRTYKTEEDQEKVMKVDPVVVKNGEEVVMPSSAPVMVRNKGVGDSFVRVGGVNIEPRKEINLWKRRTMAQPQPLQVSMAQPQPLQVHAIN
uniref:Uncharacterized protein n=1 Tax=Helianthus annuus TaxID=4232 RepID=A0A251T127_HELAN